MCDTKKCTKCGEELSLDGFSKRVYKSGKVGCRSECKECVRATSAEWRRANPQKTRAAAAVWRKNNPEYQREWCKNNPDKARSYTTKWQQNNPEKKNAAKRRWRANNPGKYRAVRAAYDRSRSANDPEYRLLHNIRSVIRQALKNSTKSCYTERLLGCSIEELRNHLERLFQPGMSWDNYGKWHIDHIIPVSYFDFSDPGQQYRAFHYTNLQPLWAIDNLKKGNKIEERQLVLL